MWWYKTYGCRTRQTQANNPDPLFHKLCHLHKLLYSSESQFLLKGSNDRTSYCVVSLKANTCLAYTKCAVNVSNCDEDGDDDNVPFSQRQPMPLKGQETSLLHFSQNAVIYVHL
jgi:hypothetical protein